MSQEQSLGVKIFGIFNIVIGLSSLVIFFPYFLYPVIFGWFADRELYGFVDWFCLAIMMRLGWSFLYIFSFFLFLSGILMLRMKVNSRKLAILSSSGIIVGYVILMLGAYIDYITYKKTEFNFSTIWGYIIAGFLFYTFLLIFYLVDPDVSTRFNDHGVRVPFKMPVIIILVSFIFPLFFVYLFRLF